MSIVLNEREWVESAIESRNLGKRPSETLSRIGRYYYQVEKYNKYEIKGKIEDFLIQCDPNVILVKWGKLIDNIVKTVDKYRLVEIGGINITEKEFDVIGNISMKQPRRLAFTLLCISKYRNILNEKNNNWVNTKDSDIMKMANINTSIKRQSLMLHNMRNQGLINFSKRVDNLNIQVNYIFEDSDTKLCVSDFRNIGNQYLHMCGENYFKCNQCGITIKRKSNRNKYCPECAYHIQIEQISRYMSRKRSNDRESLKSV